MLSGFFYLNSLDQKLFRKEKVSVSFYYLPYFIVFPVFIANSADPAQRPHSDLPMSLFGDARYKQMNV